MNNDAFSAGVEPGGLYSSQEIKILICYMLNGAGEPMPRQAVLDIIAGQPRDEYDRPKKDIRIIQLTIEN